MSNFVPNKVFLRGVLLHYFNMKKGAAESHRILVGVYVTMLYLSERVRSGFYGLKVVTLTWKTKSVPDVQKSLKTQNWRRNHHGRSLPTAIDAFKPSIEGKTATIRAEARQSNFTARQRSTSCRTSHEKILGNVEMGSSTPPAV